MEEQNSTILAHFYANINGAGSGTTSSSSSSNSALNNRGTSPKVRNGSMKGTTSNQQQQPSPPAPAPLIFKKNGFYQLSPVCVTGSIPVSMQPPSGVGSLVGSTIGSACNSAAPSKRNSPVQFTNVFGSAFASSSLSSSSSSSAPLSMHRSSASLSSIASASSVVAVPWYTRYRGWLGKKREQKGFGNSLALGLNIGALSFQKRFFTCSIRDQAVLYFKEDPASASAAGEGGNGREGGSSSGYAASTSSDSSSVSVLPLGFIPFSEVLFVEHLASTASQDIIGSGSGSVGRSKSGRSTPVQLTSPCGSGGGGGSSGKDKSGRESPGSDEDKSLRLFDIVTSFRVYHLQADSGLEAIKWVVAIRECVREYYRNRAEKLNGSGLSSAVVAHGNSNMGGMMSLGATNTLSPAAAYQTLRSGALSPSNMYMHPVAGAVGVSHVRTPRTPETSKRFWSSRGGGTGVGLSGSDVTANSSNVTLSPTAMMPLSPHALKRTLQDGDEALIDMIQHPAIDMQNDKDIDAEIQSLTSSSTALAADSDIREKHHIQLDDPFGSTRGGRFLRVENGIYAGRQIKPKRMSRLRRHFFELYFSVSPPTAIWVGWRWRTVCCLRLAIALLCILDLAHVFLLYPIRFALLPDSFRPSPRSRFLPSINPRTSISYFKILIATKRSLSCAGIWS